MNILILGCSFGVPNYPESGGGDELQEIYPYHAHTEYLLKDLGYVVFNASINAGSNLSTLERAKKLLSSFNPLETIDPVEGIVWFHTETTRDEEPYEYQYKEYQEFFATQPQAKIAIIGGAGDLMDDWGDYFNPDFCIPSWRQEILGLDVPKSNSLWQSEEYLHRLNVSTLEKLQYIENDLELRKLCHYSIHFPDGCHPGAGPHKDLSERLHRLFSEE